MKIPDDLPSVKRVQAFREFSIIESARRNDRYPLLCKFRRLRIRADRDGPGIWRFWPWVFGSCLCIWRETRALPPLSQALGSTIETEHGKATVVEPRLCLFRRKFAAFDIRTPFELKGSIRWNGGMATVEGRISIFAMVFLPLWLAAWTIFGYGASRSFPDGFTVMGWVFVAGTCLFSIPFEIRRAKNVLVELEARSSCDDFAPHRTALES